MLMPVFSVMAQATAALAGFAGQLSADLVDFPRDLTIFLNSKFFIQQIHKIPTSMDLSL